MPRQQGYFTSTFIHVACLLRPRSARQGEHRKRCHAEQASMHCRRRQCVEARLEWKRWHSSLLGALM